MRKKFVVFICIMALVLTQNFTFNVQAKDTSAPKFKSSTPTNNQKNIAVNAKITVRFNENIYKGKNYSKIKLTKSSKTVSISRSISSKNLTIKHTYFLAYSTSYTLTIPAYSLKDKAGNSIKKVIYIHFKTKAKPTPSPTPPDEYNENESNDGVENADSFPIDSIMYGSLSSESDIDTYAIQIDEADNYSFLFSLCDEDYNYYTENYLMGIWDSNDEIVAAIPVFYSSYYDLDFNFLSDCFLEPGTYYIHIFSDTPYFDDMSSLQYWMTWGRSG